MWVLAFVACMGPGGSESGLADSGDTGARAAGCVARPARTPSAHSEVAPLGAPTWSVSGPQRVFSSPRFAQLDGAGALDVTFGRGDEHGGSDVLHTVGGAVALSGDAGATLWSVDARQEVFTAALLTDVSGDGVVDPVYGGRHNELFAVDGASGLPLWTSALEVEQAREAGLYNNYSPMLVHDVDGDSLSDLLVANGGDSTQLPDSLDRPPGQLLIVSGADGSIVKRAAVPDGAETYLSPILVDGDVIFGTGGETLPGSMWRVPLSAVEAEDLSGAIELTSGGGKGFIAPPTRLPLSAGCDQLVVAGFDGQLVAVEPDGTEIWRVERPGHETYATPVLGFFDEDAVPDVFATFQEGVWPDYTRSRLLVVSGASGEVVWESTGGPATTSGNVVADVNGDGLDEVIYGISSPGEEGLEGRLFVYDPVGHAVTSLASFEDALVASPLLGDPDGDGALELVVVATTLPPSEPSWRASWFDTDWPADGLRWGAYLGTDGRGGL